jgi:hypothetical protein
MGASRTVGILGRLYNGVAFLAATIGLGHDRCEFRPRLQPPIVPAGARRMAVGRIETQPPADLLPPVKDVVDLLLRVTTVSGLDALQIDSDTLRSERTYYRKSSRTCGDACPADFASRSRPLRLGHQTRPRSLRETQQAVPWPVIPAALSKTT